jgi:hypothetical protein
VSSAATSSLSPAASTPLTLFRRIFSFPVAICSLLGLLAVCTGRGRLDDPDMWWHLKLGEIVWNTHHVPQADTFSFTAYGHPTVPHEWLAQVMLFGFYRLAGYSGIMLWLCLISSALLIGGYILCALYSSNAKVSFVGALLIWLFSTIAFSPRPQLLGYLCLLGELLILHLGRKRDPRWFFALPPLFAVWINCHGSFYFGLLLVLLILLGSRIAFQRGSLIAESVPQRTQRLLTAALGLSLPALFLNPAGWRTVAYPARILFDSPVNLSQVSEWHPLRFDDPRGIAFLCICVTILLAAATRISVLYLHELLILGVAGFEAIEHERLLIIFGLISAPVLCRMLASGWEKYSAEEDRLLPNFVLIFASLIAIWAAFPTPSSLNTEIKASSPVGAINYIHAHHISGPILNQYVFGGYLIWAAPDHPVFVDGRTDIFEWSGVFAEYGRWATLDDDPRVLLAKYGIRFCLLDRNSPMIRVMGLLPGWQQVYSDNVAVIFMRSDTHADAEHIPQGTQ